jgi:hypothetical protein
VLLPACSDGLGGNRTTRDLLLDKEVRRASPGVH